MKCWALNLDQAVFFPTILVKPKHRFLRRFRSGSHDYHDRVRIRIAEVIEQLILASSKLRESIIGFLHDLRAFVVVLIDCLPPLEIQVGILGRTAHRWILRA